MSEYPGIYRAYCVSITNDTIQAYVPQVFGDQRIPVTNRTGALPAANTKGWVQFESAMASLPVWVSSGAVAQQAPAEAEEPNEPDPPSLVTDWALITPSSSDILTPWPYDPESFEDNRTIYGAWYRDEYRVYIQFYTSEPFGNSQEVVVANPDLLPLATQSLGGHYRAGPSTYHVAAMEIDTSGYIGGPASPDAGQPLTLWGSWRIGGASVE